MLNRSSAVLLSLALAISASGCIALALGTAGGATRASYLDGNLIDTVDASLSTVHTATVSALEGLKMPIHANEVNGTSANIRSRYADEQTVWVDIATGSGASITITIRVGNRGDQRRSLHILDAIRAKL